MYTAHSQPHAWHELSTWDAQSALNFYSATMNWDFDTHHLPGDVSYWIAMKEEKPVCGIYQLRGPDYHDIAPHWMTYLTTDCLETSLDNAANAGGRVLRAPLHLPRIGNLAVLEDNNRCLLGLIEVDRSGTLLNS